MTSAPTVEEILTLLRHKDYWVSNVFQTEGGERNPFGRQEGWKVYIRNRSTTQTGMGEGVGLAEAFKAAFDEAEKVPAYRSVARVLEMPAARVAPPKAFLADDAAFNEEDLF